jgi:hypothetical protein
MADLGRLLAGSDQTVSRLQRDEGPLPDLDPFDPVAEVVGTGPGDAADVATEIIIVAICLSTELAAIWNCG